jgi:hypothetical protein
MDVLATLERLVLKYGIDSSPELRAFRRTVGRLDHGARLGTVYHCGRRATSPVGRA